MGKAIGGYVRRCERTPRGRDSDMAQYRRARCWWHHEITWQSMPILRFEEFDVPDPVDSPGNDPLASWYEQHPK